MFKAVPGGYIFQPPAPTRFHHTQAYVVNEAQKEEIKVISRRGRIFWLRTVTLSAIALALAACSTLTLTVTHTKVSQVIADSVGHTQHKVRIRQEGRAPDTDMRRCLKSKPTDGNNTVDIAGLPPGRNKVSIALLDANHKLFPGQVVMGDVYRAKFGANTTHPPDEVTCEPFTEIERS